MARLKTVKPRLKTVDTHVLRATNKRTTGIKLIRRRESFFVKQLGACKECGLVTPLREMELDHIIPLSQGGEDLEYNLQLLCIKCHKEKTLKEIY